MKESQFVLERQERERKHPQELEEQKYCLEMNTLDVDLNWAGDDRPREDEEALTMKHLMQPYIVGQDIGLFLVGF